MHQERATESDVKNDPTGRNRMALRHRSTTTLPKMAVCDVCRENMFMQYVLDGLLYVYCSSLRCFVHSPPEEQNVVVTCEAAVDYDDVLVR